MEDEKHSIAKSVFSNNEMVTMGLGMMRFNPLDEMFRFFFI
jgi:hypothetical protein